MFLLLLFSLLGFHNGANLALFGLHDQLVGQALSLSTILGHNGSEVLLLDPLAQLVLLVRIAVVLAGHLQGDDGSQTILPRSFVEAHYIDFGVGERHGGLGHDAVLNQITFHPQERIPDILLQALQSRLVHQHILNDQGNAGVRALLHKELVVLEVVAGLFHRLIDLPAQDGLIDLASGKLTHGIQHVTHIGIYLLVFVDASNHV